MKNKETKPKEGLSRLLELSGRRKHQLSAACILSILAAAARLVPFFTIYALLREIILHYQNLSEISSVFIWQLVIITAVAALCYGIFGFISSSLSHRSAYNILFELRIKLMEKLSHISSGYFTNTTQGSLKKIVQDDVEKIEEFIAHKVAAIALPIFTMIYLFMMDWRLALATLAPLLLAIILLSVGLKNPKGAQAQVDMHETREKMNSTIVEYVHGMPVIKVFNRTLSAFTRLGESINNFSDSVKKSTYFYAPAMGVYYAAMGAQLLLILPAGLLIALNASSYVDFLPILLLFFLVGTGLKEPLESMMEMALSTKNISIGLARIDDILLQPEIETAGETQMPSTYGIAFKEVTFSYNNNDLHAIDDVSFSLKENTITGLVGPSGGGKSTLAQLLLRFYDPNKGTIEIGGINIKDIEPHKLMEMIGYVFQDSILFKDTIAGNIRMGNQQVSQSEVEAAAKLAAIHDVIMELPLGYDTIIGKDNTYLSGGEKQRIAIARVFLKNPPIIVLDEATAYADAENETFIHEAFARLAADKTVIIIAHKLKTIEKADQILVMDAGKLIACDNHETLLQSSPIYRQMVEANERRDSWRMQTHPLKGALADV